MSESLWGQLPNEPGTFTPRDILFEQAAIANKAFGGRLLAGVVSKTVGGRINCELQVVVPSLNNYEVELLSIDYSPVNMYPLRLFGGDSPKAIADEGEFKAELAAVLQSARVKKIVEGLLAHTRF